MNRLELMNDRNNPTKIIFTRIICLSPLSSIIIVIVVAIVTVMMMMMMMMMYPNKMMNNT